jgi:hypothetical protein
VKIHKNEGLRGNSRFRGEKDMPLVDIKLIEGVFSEDEKEKLIKDVTDVIVSFMGENLRSYIGSRPGSKERKLGGRRTSYWFG